MKLTRHVYPNSPHSLSLQSDSANHLLRLVNLTSGLVSTLAGGLGGVSSGHADGVGTAASFNNPNGVAVNNPGNYLVVVR